MTNALQTFLSLVIQYFAPRHNAQVRFLKAQIAILRKRLPREHIVPSPEEKAELLRLGREFGHDVAPVLDVVTLPTYRRWVNDARRGRKPKRSGRPRLSPELRALVVRIGQENILWGYRRIVGELKKLGHNIASNSVKTILKQHGIHPTPEKIHRKQPPMPWGQFVASHADSLSRAISSPGPPDALRPHHRVQRGKLPAQGVQAAPQTSASGRSRKRRKGRIVRSLKETLDARHPARV